MKIILDTNIFVTCLNPASKYFSIFSELIKGSYKLCVSTEIIFEYLEVFQTKFSKAKSETFYLLLHESAHIFDIDIYFKWNLITKDPDDNKFIDCYVAANADYLVTNDNHFNILKSIDFPSINCITIDEFLLILNNKN